MKYIFFGTPEFATIILEKLINAGFIPEAVVCNPDRPIGRKKIITAPLIKKVIREKGLEKNIKILQPKNLSSSISYLLSLNPDLFIVAAYSQILPKEILSIPHLGTIGVHPSLLPKYRGPSPIQTAILNGDKETGVSLYLMDEKVDNGAIISSIKCQVLSNDNYESLIKKLAELSADLLIEILPKFTKNEITPQPQNENQATFTKKFRTEDAFIEYADLKKSQNGSTSSPQVTLEIDSKIRALNPEPGTWTIQNGKRMKILEAELINGKPRRPGGVGAPTYTSVLKLRKIQFEGKKPTKWIK